VPADQARSDPERSVVPAAASPRVGRLSGGGLASAFANLSLATLYLGFAAAHVERFREHPRASLLLMVALETLFAVFFVLRRDAAACSTSAEAWLSTVLGTFLPLLLRPVGGDDVLAAQVIQASGTAFGVVGILSLNRSIGLLPANRGVRSAGAYRFVRHPLYASYVVTQLGYIGSNPSAWNVAVAIAALAAQLVRIRGEERLLSRDPAYAAYMARTRWRLLPFVY
jgi:protein-S-isoprenylcysteine O-methyltransferase Ste14